MRIKSLASAPVVAAVCALSCARARVADVQADEDAIRSMYAQRLERIQGRSDLDSIVAAYMSVLADDAVMMPPNAPPVEGPKLLRRG